MVIFFYYCWLLENSRRRKIDTRKILHPAMFPHATQQGKAEIVFTRRWRRIFCSRKEREKKKRDCTSEMIAAGHLSCRILLVLVERENLHRVSSDAVNGYYLPLTYLRVFFSSP